MKTVIRFVTIVCFALFSMAVLAQEPTGAIEGTVTDPQGAIVQGAALTVRNAATNFFRSPLLMIMALPHFPAPTGNL